jgi:hypothetical protein
MSALQEETAISVKADDIEKYLLESIDEVIDLLPSAFEKYVQNVIRDSNQIMEERGWHDKENGVLNSLSYDIQSVKDKIRAVIYTDSPYGYLRQWGETVDGNTRIYAKENRMVVNKTGFDWEDLKSLSFQQLNELFEYGVDYFFVNSIRVVSNPYIAIPGISNEARNKIAGFYEDSNRSQASFDKFIESIFEIVNHVLKAVGDVPEISD